MKSTFDPHISAFPDIFIFRFRHVRVFEFVESICICCVNSNADEPCQRVITTQIYYGNAAIFSIETARVTIARGNAYINDNVIFIGLRLTN